MDKINSQHNLMNFSFITGDNHSITNVYHHQTLHIIAVNTTNLRILSTTIYQPTQSLKSSPKPQEILQSIYTYKAQAHKIKIFNNQLQIQKNNTIVSIIKLEPITNVQEMIKILLIKGLYSEQSQKYDDQKNKALQSITSSCKQTSQLVELQHKQIGSKLKGIGQLIQSFNGQLQSTKQTMNRKFQELNLMNYIKPAGILKNSSRQQQQHQSQHQNLKDNYLQLQDKLAKTNQMIIKLSQRIQVIQNEFNQNLAIIKESFNIEIQSLKKQDINLLSKLPLAKIDQLSKDVQLINKAFEHQIKIKDYIYIPNPKCLKNKNIFYLNNKSIKSLQEVKDYHKIIGEIAFPKGISKFQIKINNIKNNGLIFGVCSKRLISKLETSSIYDSDMISINSCGYIMVNGLMRYNNFKIVSGDTVKLWVNTSSRQVKWSCNGVEIAAAQLGYFKNEEIYPIIGLGSMLDEIQLMNIQQKADQYHSNENYKEEIARLNSLPNRHKKYY